MARTLFEAHDISDIKIVCNISMGVTCQDALKELGAPNNEQLRCHDSLHAKVYISDFGAIIGSANASENGIGYVKGESGKLLEAGIFCPAGSDGYAKASAWFDIVFRESRKVDDAELKIAPERSGEFRPRGSRKILDALPLLRRILEYPQNFPGVYIAVSDEELDEERAEQSIEERAAALSAQNIVMEDEALFQEWPGHVLRPLGGDSILCLWKGTPGVVRVDAYLNCTTWPPRRPDTIFGEDNWTDFWKQIKQKPCKRRLTEDEARVISKLPISVGNQWLFTPDEFAERLRSLSMEAISNA
jgi:hypothetical protein